MTFYSLLQEWVDDFLQWDPKEFGGLDKIVVNPAKIWVPKLAIGNRYGYNSK